MSSKTAHNSNSRVLAVLLSARLVSHRMRCVPSGSFVGDSVRLVFHQIRPALRRVPAQVRGCRFLAMRVVDASRTNAAQNSQGQHDASSVNAFCRKKRKRRRSALIQRRGE